MVKNTYTESPRSCVILTLPDGVMNKHIVSARLMLNTIGRVDQCPPKKLITAALVNLEFYASMTGLNFDELKQQAHGEFALESCRE